MKKSELKAIIRECIQEIHEATKKTAAKPAVKKVMKGTAIGKGPSAKK